ncbi:MAG: hypothetical protein KAI71_06700 [Candidatus Pacebacteria bacterium]|nr:hypothetical protein [Candidatus Paceibacterota bacterium]
MDYPYILNWISENESIVFIVLNMITLFLVVVGWFAVFLLGLKQNKKLMKNKAQMKIYEELYELRKDIDEKNIDLGMLLTSVNLLFLKMKNVKYYPEFNSSYDVWNDYLQNLIEEKSLFTNAYLKFWNHIDMWIGSMKELDEMKNIYFEELLENLTDELNKHYEYLSNLSRENYKWEEWDCKDIEERSKKMTKKFDLISGAYLDDFMVEVHNCLVYPILEYKKKPRKNFKNTMETYTILTKKGIKEVKKK